MKGINFDEDDLRIETSKLIASDTERNHADDELSTLSETHFLDADDDFFDSSDDDLNESFTKPSNKTNDNQKKGKNSTQVKK